ncbi:MAG: CCA tRNA nucleotidyltransferase [bacterium]
MNKKELEQKLSDWQLSMANHRDFSFIHQLYQKFPQADIYLVGGAVRDLIIGKETKDFDFVIRQVPAKELETFLASLGKINLVGKSFGVFKFSPTGHEGEPLDLALPRTEEAGMSGGYRDFDIQSDANLPIEADLGRRDFTINALAWNFKNEKIVDEFSGIQDLENKIIRAIGKPEQRFQEDYTRMLRAIRFSCQLNYTIEEKTLKAIHQKARELATLPIERINEELTKIILSDKAENGIRLLQELGILKLLIPEVDAGVGVGQNKEHVYEVFEHNVRALGAAASKKFSLAVRWAALLHDVAKPQTKNGQGVDSTFYNHDQLGAKMAKQLLKRLNYPNDLIKQVEHLVRYHMFYYALDTVTDSGVRRLINRLGQDNLIDFINLRICDRLGMGRPKAKPWKLLELERRFKEVILEPITAKMLKINGTELMQLLKLEPGPRLGLLLNALLGEILEQPTLNNQEYLEKRATELNKLNDEALKSMHPDIKYYEEERKRLIHQQTND